MCDYSLQHVASRPAKIEDKLVVTKFNNSITRGFAAERTMEGLHRCVGSYIRRLDPAECIAYFRHSGYEPL